MRRLLAALTLTAALALVSPIAAHAFECMPGTGSGFDMPCMPMFFNDGPPQQQGPTSMTITVTKRIVSEDRGPLSETAFPLFVDGTSVTSGQPAPFSYATHTVTETQQPNYMFDSFSGDCNSQGQIATTQSGFASCTINNRYVRPANGTVTIHKTVVNSASGTATVENFSFTVDEETPVTLGEPISLTPGQHTVTERSGTKETYYASYSASCPNGTFTVTSEQNIDCDITNSDTPPEAPTPGGHGHRDPALPATITVVTTVTNDDGGTMSPADFIAQITTGGLPMSVAGASAPGASMTVAPGDFSIEPSTSPGYAWSMSGECTGTLAAGDTATCTVEYDDTGLTMPLPPENPTDSTTDTAPVPPSEEVPPTDSGSSTPPVDITPPTDTAPTPPPAPRPRPPQPRVLGATDSGSSITVSPTTTATIIDSASEPIVTPPAENAPSCVWFWGWMGCYWWLLLLLIVLALIWKAWSKMNEKKK